MDLQVAAAFIGGAVIVGLILYIPGHYLAKYFLRSAASKSEAHSRITTLGLVVYGAMVLAMFLGFAQQYFAENTWFGHFVSTWFGRLTFATVLIAVWTGIEYSLKKRGYSLWVRPPAG
ncbi:MAG: hypothetical protein V4723_17955 [Pseudomonadota bacterium]